MGFLLRAPNGVIVEWSSVIDGPTVAMRDLDKLRRALRAQAIERASADFDRDWLKRTERLERTGTSSMHGDDWGGAVACNRAGPRERELDEPKLLAKVAKMADECERHFDAWEAEATR